MLTGSGGNVISQSNIVNIKKLCDPKRNLEDGKGELNIKTLEELFEIKINYGLRFT